MQKKLTVEKRVKEHRDLGFGLFIHWSYSTLFDMGEWVWNMYHMTKEQYYSRINEVDKLNIDFDSLMAKAKVWGFKYAVWTTRHHDGFSNYDTHGLCHYDINLRKDKRDFVKEFVTACNKYGIKPILYHTTLDWLNPDFENNFDKYLKYLNDSVELLCKNYGPIGGLWFDGNWSKKTADWKEDELYNLIRKYQPNAIIANNTGMEKRGTLRNKNLDILTFEQGKLNIENIDVGRPVIKEVCQTFNDHWGPASNDFNHKSFGDILMRFVRCRHYNANLLLNLGPAYNGNIPAVDLAELDMLSIWIKKYGFFLYTGKPTSLTVDGVLNTNDDFIVEDQGRHFLLLYNIKSGGHVNAIEYGSKQLPERIYDNIKLNIKEIRSLDNNSVLSFKQEDNKLKLYPQGFDYGYNTIIRVYEIFVK